MDFLTVVHIIIAIILILLVLVQDSKGAMGSTFGGGGGGSQTLFGATGMDNVLTKSTKVIVVFFALTCILLTRLSSQNRDSVLDIEGQRPTQPLPAQPSNNTNGMGVNPEQTETEKASGTEQTTKSKAEKTTESKTDMPPTTLQTAPDTSKNLPEDSTSPPTP